MVSRTSKTVKIVIPKRKEIQTQGTIGLSITGNLKEVGTFNANSNGTMFSRRVISDYVKDLDTEVRVTVKYKFTNIKPFMNDGVQEVMDWMIGTSATSPSHVAWGDGTLETSVIDSALENELERNVNNLTSKSNYTVRLSGLLAKSEPAGLPLTISRSGLFNDASAGVMFIEGEHFDINKTNRLEIQNDYSITIR